jgi:uncharacterized YccA/Bax inhibitor family protein
MANPVLEKQFGDQAAADAALQAGTPPQPVEAGADRMTIGSVIGATFFLLLLVGAGSAYGWANYTTVWRWWWMFAIGLIVLVIATVANPKLAAFTGVVYALGQGVFVGALSHQYADWYEGIVFLALIATLSVFLAMLFLYATRIIKVTQKLRSVIIIATVGIAVFYLVNLVLSLFGSSIPVVTGTGTPALVFSILVVIIASLNLLLDFQVIEYGITQGAPKSYSWFAAFGLMVTIVWLYIEILRLLAKLLSRR